METIRRIARYMIPHWPKALLMLIGLIGFMGLEMVPPLLLREAIDNAIPNKSMSLVLTLAGGYVLIALTRGVFSYMQWYFSELLGQSVTRDLQMALHHHLQGLHDEFFRGQKTGDIMSRVTGDMTSVSRVVSWGLMLFIQCSLIILGTVAVLLSLNWQLAAMCLITFPLMFLVVMRYDKTVRPIWRQVREKMASLTTVLQENVSGVRTVKAFAREDYEIAKFDRQNTNYFDTNMERVAVESDALPLIDFISGLSIVLLLAIGGRQVVLGKLTLGTLIAFQSYIWKLIWPIRSMGWLINSLEQALAAAPRLFELLDTPSAIVDGPGAQPAPPFRGHIEFADVSFQFADSDKPVLRNVSFTIEPGQIVAILGGTGSGKSTLINLISRFFDPTSGSVRIDGTDIRQFTLDSLRRQIGMVMQDTFLFSASIGENIAYGRPDASEEDIVAAAKLAQAHQFISQLEQGYATPIGERGIGLSGGQKQRVALARALLMNPAILILDEATSSVDSHTEDLIQEALDEVMVGRTSIIIAKRLTTIKRADLVIVVEDGTIAEMGSPAQLLAQDGWFRRMY
ncbi:MAG TPA: ABC transporter ATP-binding protein, partial [Firmicutes bacterium]|nr:ABC transporter ATP-binding protein [Bacillota bacterium]